MLLVSPRTKPFCPQLTSSGPDSGDQNERQLCQDMLVSLSSPVRPLYFPRFETHQLDWLVNREEFVRWCNSSSSQILILYGQTVSSILLEHLFRYVLGTKGPKDIVTNFLFHKGDVRFNSFETFLNTTMAEWISQDRTIPTSANTASTYRHYKTLNAFHDTDAMYLLLKMRMYDVAGTTFFILQNDDECPEMESVFWKKIVDVISIWDMPWKFLLLRSSIGSVNKWLSHWPSIHVSEHDVADITTSAAQAYIASALNNHPSHIPNTESYVTRSACDFKKAVLVMRNLDALLPVAHQELDFDELHPYFETQINRETAAIVEDIMQLVPSEQLPLLAGLVSCVLVAQRPLNRAELKGLAAIICQIDCEGALLSLEDPFDFLDRHLPAIFDLSHGEARLQFPELRSFLLHAFCSSSMNDNKKEPVAERRMARACVAYLRAPSFTRISEVMTARRGAPWRPSISSSRDDFADYAVRYWHVHMQQALTHFPSDEDEIIQFFRDQSAVSAWEKARAAVSSPTFVSHKFGLPPFALFASTGLHHKLKQSYEWPLDDKIAMQAALTQAAIVGDRKLVKELLKIVDLDDTAVIEPILSTALRLGDEGTLCILIDSIIQCCKSIHWPRRLICRAASLGHTKLMSLMIDNGASLNAHHYAQEVQNPLQAAVFRNQVEVTELLLERGPKDLVNMPDQDGWTALHDAATGGYPQMVEKLIFAGADKDTRGPFRPINCACFDGKHAAVRALLQNGVKPEYDVDDDDLWLPLPAAASYGYTKCVKALLKFGKVNVDCQSPGGTPLFMAVNNRHLDICRVLLDYKADPDSEINVKPILVLAADEDNLDAVKLLIERGNPSSDSRTMALHKAITKGTNVEIVRFLLNNGAESGGNTETGSIIVDAAAGKSTDILKALIEHDANVDEVDDHGRTPLHAAENCSMTRILLQAGANINVSTTGETLTPLHIAVDMGRTEVVKAMLEAEPDLELKSSSTYTFPGFSALAFAVWRDNAEITKLLLDAGANPNSKTERNGGVPLHLSVEEDVVRTVLEFDPDLGLEDESGETPLNNLVDWPGVTLPVIKMLLRQGSDINWPNRAGRTPLFKALEKPDLAIARLLLSKGANPKHISRRLGMPLHSTCHRGSFEAFQLILEEGGFVEEIFPFVGSVINAACMRPAESKDTLKILQHLHGMSGQDKTSLNKICGAYGCALSSACFWSSENIVKWLLEKGASVQTKDDVDRYPIHFAAYRDVSIFRQILYAGGDMAVRDKINRTVLHVAVQSGSATFVKYVLEKDRSLLRSRDKDNWAPLHYAVRGCSNWRHDQTHSRDEEDIVNLLFDEEICCSRDFTVYGHEHENWSILELARFHGSGQGVRDILKTALKKQKGVDWMTGSDVTRKAFNHPDYCDHCLMVSKANLSQLFAITLTILVWYYLI